MIKMMLSKVRRALLFVYIDLLPKELAPMARVYEVYRFADPGYFDSGLLLLDVPHRIRSPELTFLIESRLMNLGMPEMIFLAFLGLLLFGPKKLPEIGRHLGRFMAEFKRASNEFQAQLNEEVRKLEIEEESKKIKESVKESVQPIGTTAREVHSAFSDVLNESRTETSHNG
jgi:Tat protein translocase TatB subunit